MKTVKGIGFTAETIIETQIRDSATGALVKRRLPEKNLVLDAGLNSLATKAGGQGALDTTEILNFCHVGGGTNAVKISSGAITFTQVTTTLTASAGFFTAAMVNGVFKYGVGTAGDEIYITGFTSSTVVTVNISATVAAPTVGVVWQVQATTLQTVLFTTNTYQNNAGDNQTTYGTGTFSQKRTYIVAQQASPYTVNEIGYGSTAGLISGRLVLSSSDVVGTTNFYVIIITVTFTLTPNTITAVGNVGTNFNTAGNAQCEMFGITQIQGGTIAAFDAKGSNNRVAAVVAAYSQRAATLSGTLAAPTNVVLAANASRVNIIGGGVNGMNRIGTIYSALSRVSGSYNLTTSGQSCTGLLLGGTNGGEMPFDVKLTTPITLPTGTFSGTYQFDISYGRSLNN